MSIIHDALKKLEKDSRSQSNLPVPSRQLPETSPAYRIRTFSFPSILSGKNLIGIDIGSSSIKIVEIGRAGKSCRLLSAGYIRVDPLTGQSIPNSLKNYIHANGMAGRRVSSAVSSKSLTFSHIKLPPMPQYDLAKAVAWEVKKGIDFADDAIIDFVVNGEVVEDDKKKLSIIAFAIRKDEVYEHVRILKDALLKPDSVDVCSMSLLSAFDHNYGGEKGRRYALVDIGASRTTLSIVSDSSLRFTRYIPFAGNNMTKSIQESLRVGLPEAEELKLRYGSGAEVPDASYEKATEYFVDGISTQLTRSFNYYQAQLREKPVDEILISGGCACVPGLAQGLGEVLGVPVSVYDSMRNIDVGRAGGSQDMSILSPVMASAVGLALRRVGE